MIIFILNYNYIAYAVENADIIRNCNFYLKEVPSNLKY